MSLYADHDSGAPGVGFAASLRRHRLAAGLTQEELAGRSGVGVRTLRELERGRVARPQRGTVSLIADALGLSGQPRETFLAAAAKKPPNRRGVLRTAPLPAAPELIGRDRDVAELVALLASADLVTLVGLAGVGKTCLALTVAHRVPMVAAAVSVSTGAGLGDILAAVAAVWGVHGAEELADRDGLLVIDGVDRSPVHAPNAIRWLRARAPGLKILATALAGSAPDGIDWRVEPLDVPPEPAPADLAALRQYPAVALFLARLRQVRREPVHEPEAAALAELVRRLCGLPLAIELAAARGRILDVPELLDRYGNRVLDLAANESAVSWRLRDALAASYELLSPHEQRALRYLSTFRNRWSLELAEALLPDTDVEAVLDRLVGLGLVNVRSPGELRFRLLDVVSDYAGERLVAANELGAARHRHAEVIARLVGRIAVDLTGPNLPVAIQRLDYLNADIRSALRYTSAREPHTALRLCAAIPRWCRFRGRDPEAYALLRRLLDDPRTVDADPVVRAWVQVGAAMLSDGPGELYATEAALEVFLARHDVAGEVAARSVLSQVWQAVGGTAESRRHAEAILALGIRTDRPREVAIAQDKLAWQDIGAGDLAVAARRLAGAVQRATEAGDLRVRAIAQAQLAEVARLDGRYREAVDGARRALASIAEVGDPIHRVRVLGTLGQALAEAGRLTEAAETRDALSPDTPGAAGVRAMIAGYVALANGQRKEAAQAFEEAANELAGRYNVRDVFEALVGMAATVDAADRQRVMDDINGLRRRSGLTLLPRELALLGGGTDESPPGG